MSDTEVGRTDGYAPDTAPVAAPVVILNPVGGRGHGARMRRTLERLLLHGRGDLVVTTGPGHAEQLASAAAQDGRDVIAVGGDGTVAEAGNGVLKSGRRVTLGVVPCGSGNDYALQTLNVPEKFEDAVEIALHGTPTIFDAGIVNGRYFLNSLGIGIDANIAAAAERIKRYPFMSGQRLYWAASLSELLFHYDRCPELTIQFDDSEQSTRTIALAAVTVGRTYGGGFRINPGADPHDGLLDMCTLWKPPLVRALRLLPMVEKGKHLNEPEVSHHLIRTAILASGKPVHAHLDGEVLSASRFEVSVVPAALTVRCGPLQ